MGVVEDCDVDVIGTTTLRSWDNDLTRTLCASVRCRAIQDADGADDSASCRNLADIVCGEEHDTMQ